MEKELKFYDYAIEFTLPIDEKTMSDEMLEIYRKDFYRSTHIYDYEPCNSAVELNFTVFNDSSVTIDLITNIGYTDNTEDFFRTRLELSDELTKHYYNLALQQLQESLKPLKESA